MKKIFVVLLFIVIAGFVCYIAPNYFVGETYEPDEVRVVFNQNEITHNVSKLPQKAIVIDGKVMLSKDTVDILFDKWLYYDEKYDTIISTTDNDVVKLKIGENKIDKNGVVSEISVPVQLIDDIIYIPIEELQDIYDIKVENNEKIIITENSVSMITATLGAKLKMKAYKKILSKTIAKCEIGEVIDVFEYQNNPEWVVVRNSVGDLGYVKMTSIVSEKNEANLPPLDVPKQKVNLIWEYAENYTPDRSGEKKIDGINVVSPTWIYLKNANGELKNTINTDYISWAHKQGYKIWAAFKNDGMGLDETSANVTDMKNREKMISSLINICTTYKLDGINVDFEGMKKEDSEEFSQFVRELSATLRRNNLAVSVDVTVPDGSDTWSLCYDRYELADAVDYLVLMAYDQYGASSKVPGSTAEVSWVDSNLKKMIERDNIDSEKIVLGIPLYSRLWWVKNEKLSTRAIPMATAIKYLERQASWNEEAGQYYVEYQENGTTYMLWVEEETAIRQKLNLIEQYNLAGAAYWRYGYETDDFWEKIK